MGTWGVHSFENDDAVDWAAAYREMGLGVAKSTIDVALGDLQNGALAADLSCRAIAAAEAVAFALGRGSTDGDKVFSGAPVADRAAAEALIENADDVVSGVENASQLKLLWTEADQFDDWSASLTDLRARLNGGTPNDAQPEIAQNAASAPVERAPTATAQPQSAASNDAVLAAISQLSADVQKLRQEVAESALRLAEIIEARD